MANQEFNVRVKLAIACWFVVLSVCQAPAYPKESAFTQLEVGSKFAAADTLACDEGAEADAEKCLANLRWSPAKFTVQLEAAEPGCGDWLVRFPSPRPTGNPTGDLVSMEWFAARDEQCELRKAPAIVVIHESGRRMTVGRLIARGLSGQGLHAFLLHLPGYGPRRAAGAPDSKQTIPPLPQAIADARRARDAVASLPMIDRSVIGLQGTSLGGFVAATVAGLDQGYDRVFILMAGGNLQHVILHGSQDAAKMRQRLFAAGLSEQQIKELVHEVEPLRLAHRVDPNRTWLYSGKFDDVVPPACSIELAQAARLSASHHIVLPVNHYSAILFLPRVTQEIFVHMSAADHTPPAN